MPDCVSLPDSSSSPVGTINSLSRKVSCPICKKSMEPFREFEEGRLLKRADTGDEDEAGSADDGESDEEDG